MVRHYESLGLLPAVARAPTPATGSTARRKSTRCVSSGARATWVSAWAEIAELLKLWQNRRRPSASVKRIAAGTCGGAGCRDRRVSAKMARHYESLGLLPAVTAQRSGGYRQHIDKEIQTLRFIRRARDLGFSMAEIGELLKLWQNRRRPSASAQADRFGPGGGAGRQDGGDGGDAQDAAAPDPLLQRRRKAGLPRSWTNWRRSRNSPSVMPGLRPGIHRCARHAAVDAGSGPA